MLSVCLIVLSCYTGSFDAKKPVACAINASQITTVEHWEDSGRYMVYMRGKYARATTIVESPSQVKKLIDKCRNN
jgi:hypothetical protein